LPLRPKVNRVKPYARLHPGGEITESIVGRLEAVFLNAKLKRRKTM
jgi:hypothetical protein